MTGGESVREEQIRMVLYVTAGLTGGLVFFSLRMLGRRERQERRLLRTYREITGVLRERSRKSSLYQNISGWLTENGAPFHYGKRIDPVRFLAACLILGTAGFAVFIRRGILYALTALLLLTALPAGLLPYLNKRDNEALLPELKLVYHALDIQIAAGVYITDALAECYGSVQEKRLRQALLELAGDIVLKADVVESLGKFQGKFNNPYVDTLCITVLQALESGQAVELLRDIGEQIRDMEEAALERKKAALDRKITFCQLGVLVIVLGIALFLCVRYMFSTAASF